MQDKKPIEQGIQELEARIEELRGALKDWDRVSVNNVGAKMYKEKVNRIVLQAQTVESLIKEKVFPN
jgi:hypothetical protein